MNYQTELLRYQRMYNETPPQKWMTRKLIANHIDRILQERNVAEARPIPERCFDGFSFRKPSFPIPIVEGRGLPPRDPKYLIKDGWAFEGEI